MIRRPFFSFYGSKFRIAQSGCYPPPSTGKIIEPFAGSAGYSCAYYWLDVHLYDLDPIIVSIWDFLIHASVRDILSIPTPDLISLSHVDEIDTFEDVKCLIGFWLARSSWHTRKSLSAWGREHLSSRPSSFWGPEAKSLLARQVPLIRHWKISLSDFRSLPNETATWFIDPPYSSSAGRKYFGSATINYAFLAEWSRSRRGQKIVCEHNGAKWLPFSLLREVSGARKELQDDGSSRAKRSQELLWTA